MDKILRTLKNWWFAFIGIILIVLDQGFELINPLLVEVGISGKWIGILKLIFGIYGIYKLKKSLPTQNPDKLNDIVKNTIAGDQQQQGPGGSNTPPDTKDK